MDEIAFGRYRLIEVIGRGGMGAVYRARDTVIDREVAVKVLPAELANEPGYRERFRREAHTAARLAEPHIIPIYDTGEIDGQLYLVMPVVDGLDLTSVLRRDGVLQPALAVRVIEQLAAALDAAHKRGLVHRDVKPSNALVTPSAFVYLIDFGIAHDASATKLTNTGMTMGTWGYMAPERFSSGVADARGDVYALACVLCECLTGRPAFPGESLQQQVAGHLTQDPPKPSALNPALPTAIDEVIARGMAKDPDERYQTAPELADDARRALAEATAPTFIEKPTVPISATQPAFAAAAGGQADGVNQQPTQLASTALAPPPQPPSPPGTVRPGQRRPGRRRLVIAALGAVALLIGAGIVAGLKLTQHHNPTASTSPSTAAAANPGPFTGTYRVDLATPTDLNGNPIKGSTPDTDTWRLRSVCRAGGCVATAARVSGTSDAVPTWVFDQVGGTWLAVALGSYQCGNTPVELWQAINLQPQPNGTLTGEMDETTTGNCHGRRTVTFTRTGDMDINSLPDPAALPARVESPAAALHGRYRETTTYANSKGALPTRPATDYAVATNCLRTGDRCMSYFHAPNSSRPLVFSAGTWNLDLVADGRCPGSGDPAHTNLTAQYPLPQPPQDPIAVLTGHGHWNVTGSCGTDTDTNETFTRTGD
jgi:serine/threonine protein kinase